MFGGKKEPEVHYDVQLDEEHQDELMRAYQGTLKHYEDNSDDLTKFYKGATIVGIGIIAARVFWEPMSEAAVKGAHKATDFVRTRVFKKDAKYAEPSPDGDITVEATVTDVKEES